MTGTLIALLTRPTALTGAGVPMIIVKDFRVLENKETPVSCPFRAALFLMFERTGTAEIPVTSRTIVGRGANGQIVTMVLVLPPRTTVTLAAKTNDPTCPLKTWTLE